MMADKPTSRSIRLFLAHLPVPRGPSRPPFLRADRIPASDFALDERWEGQLRLGVSCRARSPLLLLESDSIPLRLPRKIDPSRTIAARTVSFSLGAADGR